MSYYFSKTLGQPFESVLSRVKEALQAEGFGILTDIDVRATIRQKLDLDFRNYRILGACSPPLAHRALEVEDKIGTLLPCNVIVQELAGGEIEVAAVDPVASMQAIENARLRDIATAVARKLEKVIQGL